MIVVDASVWMSYLVATYIYHSASRKWLEANLLSSTPLVAPVLLLAEVGGAAALVTGQPELGRQAVERLLNIPTLRLVSIDHELGFAAARLAAEHRLRGADATYVAVAAALNVPLVSWDRQQMERASAVVKANTPNYLS